ncbi:MAG TPA: hypothetical protein VF792_08470 [Ktedonobacterales bacterium]
MRITKSGAVRGAIAACAVVATLAFGAMPALADGSGAQTNTITMKNAYIPFGPGANPCTGASGTLAATSVNGVLHETINKAGDIWDTGTLTGTFQFVPDDSTQPTYTGHGTTWFGDSFNNQNTVNHFTMNLNLTGTDGSSVTMHENGHFGVSASGIPNEFDHVTVTCG